MPVLPPTTYHAAPSFESRPSFVASTSRASSSQEPSMVAPLSRPTRAGRASTLQASWAQLARTNARRA
eukprot:c22585_g2_i1 orf=36-239(+)